MLSLLGVSGIALGIGAVVLRDADPDAVAADAEALPEVEAPASASPWPLVGAFGAVITAVGLVVGSGLFVLGLVILGVTVIEWAVKAWADRATGDPAVNAAIRNRLMTPIEIPVAAVLVIGFLTIATSRVFLAVSKDGATVVATVALIAIVAGAVFVYRRREQSATVATVMLVILAVLVLAGGIAGVAAGEREFEEHGGEHSSEVEGS